MNAMFRMKPVRSLRRIAQTRPWGFVNVNLRPFYSEGSKTLAFEVVEQMGWEAPEHIVVPAASGSLPRFRRVDEGAMSNHPW